MMRWTRSWRRCEACLFFTPAARLARHSSARASFANSHAGRVHQAIALSMSGAAGGPVDESQAMDEDEDLAMVRPTRLADATCCQRAGTPADALPVCRFHTRRQALALSMEAQPGGHSAAAGGAAAAAPPPWAPGAPAAPAAAPAGAALFANLFAPDAQPAARAGGAAAASGSVAEGARVPSPPSFPSWWATCGDSAPWKDLPSTGVAFTDTAAALAGASQVMGCPIASLAGGEPNSSPAGAIPLALSASGDGAAVHVTERALSAVLKSRIAPRRLAKGEDELTVLAAVHNAAVALSSSSTPHLGALCRQVIAKHLATSLAADGGQDLYFDGGRVRTAFSAALAAGSATQQLLDDLVATTLDAKTAGMWEEMLRSSLQAVKGAPLDDVTAVEARLRSLDRLTACPSLARCLGGMLHAEAAAAATGGATFTGANFEARSCLSPLLTFGPAHTAAGPSGLPGPGAAETLQRLPKYPGTMRGDRERVVGLLGKCAARVAAATHAVLERVVKQRGACMEAVLAWLAAATAAGAPRAQAGGVHGTLTVSPAARRATSDAFALGLTALCLRFCRPFLDGAPKPLNYIQTGTVDVLARRWRVDRSGEDPLLTGADAAAVREAFEAGPDKAAWRPFFAPSSEAALPHFVNECFVLALLAVHTCLVPAVEAFERARYQLSRSVSEKEDLEGHVPFATLVDVEQAALLDENLAGDVCRLSILTCAWLLRSTSEGTAEQQRRACACIPGSVLRDLSTYLQFTLAFGRADLISGAASQHLPVAAVVEAAAGVLTRRDLVTSPLVTGAMVSMLHAMLSADRQLLRSPAQGRTGSAAHDALVGAVLANPAARRLLCPALIIAYASLDAVEGLDVDKDDFDKFTVRNKIATLLAELWHMPECVASVAAMADASSAAAPASIASPFAAFAQAALLDLMYLLEDALQRLVDIRNVQLAQADETAWAAQPPNQRQEKLRFLEAQENAARGFMSQARATVKLLNMLAGTSSVAKAFVTAPVAGGAAYAAVHFLELLLGPKCEGLKVKEPEKYKFDPKKLLLAICEFTLRLDAASDALQAAEPGTSFAAWVAGEDDYSREVLEKAGGILTKHQLGDASHVIKLRAFIHKCDAARHAAQQRRGGGATGSAVSMQEEEDSTPLDPAWEAAYVAALQPLLYHDVPSGSLQAYFRQFEEIAARPEGNTKAKTKRLAREIASFAASDGLPLSPGSAICVRSDEERMDKMRALVTGPSGTPYALGCFVFDVYFPEDYPNKAPLVNFDTTGGGRVRFSPNLYADGKVCLSLLGTWHGGHASEKWNSSSSTLLQVLISIQAMILVDEPWYSEPGSEGMQGTAEGKARSKEYNEQIQLATVRHGMLAQLRKPRAGLEDAIVAHFRAADGAVRRQCAQWVRQCSDETLKQRMAEAVGELFQELDKLKQAAAA